LTTQWLVIDVNDSREEENSD